MIQLRFNQPFTLSVVLVTILASLQCLTTAVISLAQLPADEISLALGPHRDMAIEKLAGAGNKTGRGLICISSARLSVEDACVVYLPVEEYATVRVFQPFLRSRSRRPLAVHDPHTCGSL